MTILSELKFSDATPTRFNEPKQHARLRLLAFLNEQHAAAEAELAKKPFNPTRLVSRTGEGGNRTRVEVPKRIRRAWFVNRQADGSSVTFFQLRYGNRPLAIAGGKTTVEVGDAEKLPAVIAKIIEAVQAGELDEVLASAAAERRAHFAKSKKKA
jgi:hypothetical protein